MKIILTRGLLFLMLAVLPVINSCDTGINIFSLQDDVQLGQELNAQIQSDPQEYPIFRG